NARLFTRMEELATTDPLTGLYNRRHFFVMAENELERALRYEKPLIVMMLDFDHFKSVNDTYGHRVGDQTLQAVAKLCTHELRKMDIIGRYGGDEFAIILPETEKEEGFEVADRLRRSVAETPILCHRGSIHITISIGLANLTKESPSIELLLDLADQALYNAKQAGRNHITALE
ncbi:MAG: GGDEF domain-containing protein, partial [Chloroflexota bacterium]